MPIEHMTPEVEGEGRRKNPESVPGDEHRVI